MVNLIVAIVVEAMNRISKDEEAKIIGEMEKHETATKEDLKKLERKIDELSRLLKKGG